MVTNKKSPESTIEDMLEFPCIPMTQGKHILYCFVISARTLSDLVRINRRDTDKETGYQRPLSPSRVKAIANYIDGKNSIPNSILIALDDPDVQISDDGRKLTIPNKPDTGWVIDGQHRLAGAIVAKEEIELLVIAFVGIDKKQQIQQFIIINREAKGVPTSLYYDLLKDLPDPKTPQEIAHERAADIGNDLRKDDDSNFFSRVVLINPKRGEISLTNFVRKVTPLVKEKGRFAVYTYLEQRGILYNYFKALEEVFPKEFTPKTMTFFRTLGFGAVINALTTVFDLSMKHYKGFKIEHVVQVLRRIDFFNFSDWKMLGSGSSAEIQAGNDLRTELLNIFEETSTSGSIEL